MRKIFLIPLLTLVCSVMAWGTNVATWGELMEAVATPNAAITLTADCNIPEAGTYDFNGATITCGAYKLVGGVAGDVFTFKNATFTGGTENGTPAIKVEAGDSVSLVNIASTNLNGACIQSIALALRIGEDCNMACNTRFHAVSNGYNGAKIYNYGTIRGLSTSGAIATIYNYGTINSISQGVTSNTIYVSNRSVTVNNYGLCNGMLYNYTGCGVTIHNYSTGEMVGGVEVRDTGADSYATADITNDGIFTQTQSINHGGFRLINNGTATIQNGTFVKSTRNKKNYLELTGTQSIHIYNGTGTRFVDVPTGNMAIIHPNCIFEQGVGSHTIVDGYYWRESDGMIVEIPHYVAEITHANSEVEYSTDLHEALTTAADGDIIKMIDDATLNYTARLNVNQSVAAKHLTLDINGHEFRAITSVIPTLELYAGSLNIINSVPGVGGIYNEATSAIAINVYGSVLKNCNPKTAAIEDLYTYLNIAEGVNIYATTSGSSAIVVNHATKYVENDVVINKGTEIYETSSSSHAGVANGVRVDVHGSLSAQKYAFKVNGTVAYPDASKYSSKTKMTYGEFFETVKEFFYGPGTTETISVADTAYSPYIHIYPTAVLDADHTNNGAAGLYASGYARYDIEGTCKGAAGVYVKSGVVNLQNADVRSTWTETATINPGKHSGIIVGGHALVLESNDTYSGHIVLNVLGDTRALTNAPEGIALFEVVANSTSRIDAVSIDGGEFTGRYAMALNAETVNASKVVVYGVTATANDNVVIVDNMDAIMAENTHKVVIPNNDGTTTVIVSKGEVPTSITEFGDTSDPKAGEIVSLLPGSDVNWTGTNAGVIGDGSNSTILSLGELQIISGTEENKQLLTIKENATLEVDRLIMSENARIVVKEGAKLIVKGTQGINAPSTENILLESSEDKQCIFLFHPEVTSNRHPSATYKFASKARYANGIYTWQRFGAPTYNGATTMTWEGDVKTALYKYDYSVDNWVQLPMSQDNIYEIEGRPFACYNMTINENPAEDVVYTFTGELMGNNDAPLKFVRGWNSFANSYAAPIDVKSLVQEIFDEFESGVDATVYIYNRNADGTTGWNSINGADLIFSEDNPVINSMQAFILHANNQAEGAVSYERNVYEPIIPSNANQAPARRMRDANAYNGVSLTFTDGVQSEVVKLLEGEEFSDEFDNMYDAVKLENDNNFSAYCIIGEEKYSTVATNDLTNKAIVFDNKVAGTFTLNVNSAVGELLKLYDAVAKQLVNLEKGTSYEFEAEAVNDPQRFIVKPSDIPSSIDETEIVLKASKFVGADGQIYILRGGNVYSIQGQQIH